MPSACHDLGKTLHEALAPIAPLEQQLHLSDLEQQIFQYFRGGAKHLDFENKPWWDLIDQYCDTVFMYVWQNFGARQWLNQVDFLRPVDAGIRELFPATILECIPQDAFERAVIRAHDRAYEEYRFGFIFWEVLLHVVKDPPTKKTIYDAFVAGRKEAVTKLYAAFESVERNASIKDMGVEDFLDIWVWESISRLRGPRTGVPAGLLPEPVAAQLFHTLSEAGTFPMPLVAQSGPPPEGWTRIDEAVRRSFSTVALSGSGKGSTGGWMNVDYARLSVAASAGGALGDPSLGACGCWDASPPDKRQRRLDLAEASDPKYRGACFGGCGGACNETHGGGCGKGVGGGWSGKGACCGGGWGAWCDGSAWGFAGGGCDGACGWGGGKCGKGDGGAWGSSGGVCDGACGWGGGKCGKAAGKGGARHPFSLAGCLGNGFSPGGEKGKGKSFLLGTPRAPMINPARAPAPPMLRLGAGAVAGKALSAPSCEAVAVAPVDEQLALLGVPQLLAKGHPQCTSKEDCLGTPSTALMRQVDLLGAGNLLGNLFCADCWKVMQSADPMLNAREASPLEVHPLLGKGKR